MNRLKRIIAIILPILSILPAWGGASISVQPLNLMFSPADQENYQSVKIKNLSDETAYVAVDATRLADPGHSDTRLSYLGEDPGKFGLLVSDTRLIIPPYQQRVITVTNLLQNNPVDAVYALSISPVNPALLGVDVTGEKNTKTVATGVQIIVGYQVNVFVKPVNPSNPVKLSVKDQTLSATNTGNSFNVLEAVFACPMDVDVTGLDFTSGPTSEGVAALKPKCGPPLGFAMVYAKSTVTMKVPADKKIVVGLYRQSNPVVLISS
jgi:hypothetical protein